uniref:Uncharacterized protein n=1 Tax=Glossina pallidipes TaxID=7398 RepID=A0A1A9ZGW3_GLOPL
MFNSVLKVRCPDLMYCFLCLKPNCNLLSFVMNFQQEFGWWLRAHYCIKYIINTVQEIDMYVRTCWTTMVALGCVQTAVSIGLAVTLIDSPEFVPLTFPRLLQLPESCARNCALPLCYPVNLDHVGNAIRMSGSALFQSPFELRFPEFAYEMALAEHFFTIKEQQRDLDKDIKDILAMYKNPAITIPVHNREVAHKSRIDTELRTKSHLSFSEFLQTISYVAVFFTINEDYFLQPDD